MGICESLSGATTSVFATIWCWSRFPYGNYLSTMLRRSFKDLEWHKGKKHLRRRLSLLLVTDQSRSSAKWSRTPFETPRPLVLRRYKTALFTERENSAPLSSSVAVTDRKRRQYHGLSRGARLRPHHASAGWIEILPAARAMGVTIPGLRQCCME